MREEIPVNHSNDDADKGYEGEVHPSKHKANPFFSWVTFAAISGFMVGMVVMGVLVTIFSHGPTAKVDKEVDEIQSGPGKTPAPLTPVSRAHPIEDLRQRHLNVPVQGVAREDLKTSFRDRRGFTRRHAAIDILAARYTQVVAVEDGTIARLFRSEAGGITVYQFDPAKNYVYYYAHLDRYANGLKEGAAVKRGQVLGFVGTSGNAPRDAPHLHFAILKLTAKKQWWKGTAIDPYLVLK